MNRFKNVTVFVIMTAMLVSLTACGGEKKEAEQSVSIAETSEVAMAKTPAAESKKDPKTESSVPENKKDPRAGDATKESAAEDNNSFPLPDLSGESHEDAGYYSIYAYTENNTRFTAEELAAAGVAFDLMLCPDGTGYANFIGENYDLSWKDGYIHVLTEDGVQKMDYGSGNYMGRKTLSLTEDTAGNDVIMSFEYAGEADKTYQWKSASAGKAADTAKASDADKTADAGKASDADKTTDTEKTTDTGKTETATESPKQEAQSAPSSAPAEDVTYSFKGYKVTLPGDFAYQFFGTDSPESLVNILSGSKIHFWLVDPETGKGVADGNCMCLNHNTKDLQAQAEDNASRIKDAEYLGEQNIGSVKAYTIKKSKDKDSEIWRTVYFEADGNTFMISGTFSDLDTLGKLVDLFIKNVKVEKE